MGDADEFKGGEVVFCGSSNWSLVGRSSKTEKFDGIEDCQVSSFHRLESLKNVRIKKIFTGPKAAHNFAIDMEGKLYSWGRNENGELGQGHLTNVYQPTEVASFPAGEKAIGGACGVRHSLVMTESGKLFSAGQGSSAQLGNGKTPEIQENFTQILGFGGSKVISCSAGREFSMAVTEDGDLFAFGHPRHGQLGNGSENKFLEKSNKETFHLEKEPLKVQFPEGVKIVKVASGDVHSIAMDDQGRLYSWGFGGYGRLGHKDNKDQMTPSPIALFHEEQKPLDPNLPKFMQQQIPPTRAKDIFCGATASFAVIAHSSGLFLWGITKKSGEAFMYPQACSQVSGWRIRSASCGNTSTIVATERMLITWGPSPTFGELGYGPNGAKSSTVSKGVDDLEGALVHEVGMAHCHSLALVDMEDKKSAAIVEKLPVFNPDVTPKEGKKRKNVAKGKRKKKTKTEEAGVEVEQADEKEEELSK